MSLPILSRRSCSLLLFAPWALTACRPSDDEIQKMVDARVGALQQRLEEEKVIKTDAELEKQKAEEAAKSEWERSNDFLAELDRLMSDYKPQLPEVRDDTDVLACVTEAGLAQNENLKAASSALYADVRKGQKAREEAERAFERRRWLQYRFDMDWAKRIATKEIPPQEVCREDYWGDYNCWVTPAKHLDAFGNDDYDRQGQHLYSRTETPDKPELMKRVEAAGLAIPERFWCKVEQASVGQESDGWPLLVACKGNVTSFITVRGDAPSVNIGDIVSVPLKDTAFDPMGVLAKVGDGRTWQITATSDTLKLETPAECPSDETIALKALETAKSARDAAPLIALLRGSPPVTDEGKRKVAEDDLRSKRYADAAALYEAINDVDGMAAAARGLASANDAAAAIALLKKVTTGKKDPALLQLLGGLEVQAGDTAAGQAHLREAASVATDVKTVKDAMAVLSFIGDADGAAQAKTKACELGDKRSCK